MSPGVSYGPSARRSVDDLLAQARARLCRADPEEAYREQAAGAILADIRPAAQRRGEGQVPGALIVERNVLEWRFDPASEARLPQISGYDIRVIVMCSQGYTSSLAAASLQDLGLLNATDLAGGFQAWARAGLPVIGTCFGRWRPDGCRASRLGSRLEFRQEVGLAVPQGVSGPQGV